MKFRKDKVVLRYGTEGVKMVDGYVEETGRLGIVKAGALDETTTKSWRGWRIVHLASGKYIGSVRKLSGARKLVEDIYHLARWMDQAPKFTPDNRAKIMDLIAEARRGVAQ